MDLDSCWQVLESAWARIGVFTRVKQSRAPAVGVLWLQSVWINMQDWKPSGHFVLDRGGEVSERDGEGERE